jgi:hypothetical protein
MAQPSLAPALDILECLVAFDTRSSESNLPLIEYVRGVLRGHGIEASMVYDASRTKANLYATIGPQDRRGLCLWGHTDVVPAGGQPWTVPAFEMTRAADRAGLRRGRHERLPSSSAGDGAALRRSDSTKARPSGLQLRRGSRLPGRARVAVAVGGCASQDAVAERIAAGPLQLA